MSEQSVDYIMVYDG